MTEPVSFIPSRVKNCAEGGHVAGAIDIIDDGSGITLDELVGNKEYTPADFSGMGRVVLKKNIVNGVNTLSQSMINKANTIYVIQYDFTLEDTSENISFDFTSSNVSGIMTPEKAELDAATAAYDANPTDENLARKQVAQAAYEAIGSQNYYYWVSYTIPAHCCLHLTGRAFRLNDSKNAQVATEYNQGIIYAPSNESLTVYVGNLAGQYSYLKDEYVRVPDNCVLEFNGSLSKGTISGTNTSIKAGLTKIFNTDVILSGTWNVAEAYPEWFGAKGDGLTDDTYALRKVTNAFYKIILQDYKTYITRLITLTNDTYIFGGTLKEKAPGIQNGGIIKITENANFTAKNVTFDGDGTNITAEVGYYCLIECTYGSMTLDKCIIKNTKGNAIHTGNLWGNDIQTNFAHDILITDCTILLAARDDEHPGTGNSGDAIRIERTHGARIHNNFVVGGLSGIRCQMYCKDLIITNNVVKDSWLDVGITAAMSERVFINGNECSGHYQHGFEIDAVVECEVSNNYSHDNKKAGFFVTEYNTGEINYNYARGIISEKYADQGYGYQDVGASPLPNYKTQITNNRSINNKHGDRIIGQDNLIYSFNYLNNPIRDQNFKGQLSLSGGVIDKTKISIIGNIFELGPNDLYAVNISSYQFDTIAKFNKYDHVVFANFPCIGECNINDDPHLLFAESRHAQEKLEYDESISRMVAHTKENYPFSVIHSQFLFSSKGYKILYCNIKVGTEDTIKLLVQSWNKQTGTYDATVLNTSFIVTGDGNYHVKKFYFNCDRNIEDVYITINLQSTTNVDLYIEELSVFETTKGGRYLKNNIVGNYIADSNKQMATLKYEGNSLCWLNGVYREIRSVAKDVNYSGTVRPTGDKIYVGFMFLDTSSSPAKPIYASAIAASDASTPYEVTWIDALGNPA